MAANGIEAEVRAQEALGKRLHQWAGEWVTIRDADVVYHAVNFDDLLSQIEGDPNPGYIMRVAEEQGMVCFYQAAGIGSCDHEFPYLPGPTGLSSPIVHFDLTGPGGRAFPVSGMVDSGADLSLFPLSWASPLGIELTECERIGGRSASGTSEYRHWSEPLKATLLDKTIELSATFGGVNIALLGREDFFKHFRVAFDQPNRRFFLTPVD